MNCTFDKTAGENKSFEKLVILIFFSFGHNAAITDFVNKFGDVLIENVPTSELYRSV
jgi:hypothetical protein